MGDTFFFFLVFVWNLIRAAGPENTGILPCSQLLLLASMCILSLSIVALVAQVLEVAARGYELGEHATSSIGGHMSNSHEYICQGGHH